MIKIIEDFLTPRITWEQFKDFVNKFNLIKAIRYIEYENKYFIWVKEEGIVLNIELLKNTEEAEDFENNFKPLIAPLRAKDGKPILSTASHHIGKGLYWKGLPLYTIPAGTTQYFYYREEGIIELQGGRYIAVNGSHKDKGEFSIVIKGTSPEQDIIIRKFIEVDIYPNKLEEFISDQTTTINFTQNPNLHIRIKYISEGTEDVDLKVRLLLWS